MSTNTLAVLDSAKDFAETADIAAYLVQSPFIPPHIRDGGNRAAAASLILANGISKSTGIDTMQVLNNLYIVHGRPAFSTQFYIALANKAGVFRGPINYDIQGTGDSLSVTAYATSAASGNRIDFTVTLAEAKAEGWVDKKGSKYRTRPELMLRYRAASGLIRMYHPEVAMGFHTDDEAEDIPPHEPRNITPPRPAPTPKPAPAAKPAPEVLPPSDEDDKPAPVYELYDRFGELAGEYSPDDWKAQIATEIKAAGDDYQMLEAIMDGNAAILAEIAPRYGERLRDKMAALEARPVDETGYVPSPSTEFVA